MIHKMVRETVRKTAEQQVYEAEERAGENTVQNSTRYVSDPAGLYASNRDERSHLGGHSLPSPRAFSWGKGLSLPRRGTAHVVTSHG